MSASIHPTSPPHLCCLLTASQCWHFHSLVSSPCAASQHTQISASFTLHAKLTLCTGMFCGKKNGIKESSALCSAVGADVDSTPWLNISAGTKAVMLENVGSFRFSSILRSSSESRSRWLIRENSMKVGEACECMLPCIANNSPSSSRGANRSLELFFG